MNNELFIIYKFESTPPQITSKLTANLETFISKCVEFDTLVDKLENNTTDEFKLYDFLTLVK